MSIAIISDRLHSRRYRYNFDTEYSGDADLYTWTDSAESGITANCFIYDLDFADRANEDIITNGVEEIRSRFNIMTNNVTNWLEGGQVVIGLLSQRYTTRGLINQPTNYDWLDRLQVISRAEHEKIRTKINVVSEIPGLKQYFDYVNGYQYGIRLEETTVGDPEILAQHQIDKETVAVAIREYLDPDGNHRTPPGHVVLLPQPTNIDTDFHGLIESLEETANHYLDRTEYQDLFNEQGRINLEKVLEMGEGDAIELKEELPDNAHKFAKDMVAFSNKWGGIFVVGINDEDHSVEGVEDVDKVKNRIAGVAAKSIDPPIDPVFETHIKDGEQIVVARINQGSGPLYTTSEKVYWRFGPTSESISGSEIREYILPS